MTYLTESEHYIVEYEYETVFLKRKADSKKIVIGDFYGDVKNAIIDTNETFCVMYGCGVIVYYLQEPFIAYKYNYNSTQWLEVGRYAKHNVEWVDNVEIISIDSIKIVLDDGSTRIIAVTKNK